MSYPLKKHIYIYIYIYTEKIDFCESDSMIKIFGKLDKSNTELNFKYGRFHSGFTSYSRGSSRESRLEKFVKMK